MESTNAPLWLYATGCGHTLKFRWDMHKLLCWVEGESCALPAAWVWSYNLIFLGHFKAKPGNSHGSERRQRGTRMANVMKATGVRYGRRHRTNPFLSFFAIATTSLKREILECICLLSRWRGKPKHHQAQMFHPKVTTLPADFESMLKQSRWEEAGNYWGNVFHFYYYCKMPLTQSGTVELFLGSLLPTRSPLPLQFTNPPPKCLICLVLRLLKR